MNHKISYFRPKRLLKNTHLQTTWRTLTEKFYPYLEYQKEVLETPDEDHVYCFHYPVNKPKGIAIVLPGISSYLKSPYIRDMFLSLKKAHLHGVLLLPRCEAGFINRKPLTFHGGMTEDITHISPLFKSRYNLPIYAVGFSMGGNTLLKYLGERGREASIERAVTISPPFHIRKVVERIDSYVPWLYKKNIIPLMVENLKKKYPTKTLPIDYEKILEIQSCIQYLSTITLPLHGYDSLESFFAQNDCLHYLNQITTPTQIIHSIDDPLVCKKEIPSKDALSPSTELYLTKHGGHIGFIGSFAKEYPLSLGDKVTSFFLEK